MKNFKKIVRIGENEDNFDIFCEIIFNEGRLSISGVEGPMRNGDAKGSCGQIDMHLNENNVKPAPAWNKEMLTRFFQVWKAWHLNDMQAGSPAQTAWLKEHPTKGYQESLAALTAAGLNPDPNYLRDGKPHRYGTAWLRVEVPQEVLNFLMALPDTDQEPAWV